MAGPEGMTLAGQLGVRQRELIALVGGGGKSTLMFRLGAELAAGGRRVILTTTTKMGRSQIEAVPNVCDSIDGTLASRPQPGPIMLVTGGDSHKVKGPRPEELDTLARHPLVDFVVVEADGAHGRPLKAPAAHEPVVPSSTTMVVIAMGIDAVGGRLMDVAHRVERAVAFTGFDPDRVMTPEDCALVLSHPEGALRKAPAGARVVVALTKVTGDSAGTAERVRRALAGHPAIDDVVAIRAR